MTAQPENMPLATTAPSVKKANQPSPQAWLVCNIKNNISLFYAQSKAEGI